MRKTLDTTLERILSLLMALLVIDVLWQVASRYILADPSSVTDEIACFLLMWIGLLGAAYCYGLGEHLAVDIIDQYVSEKNRVRLELFSNLMVTLFAITVMIIGGTWLVYTRLMLGVTSAALSLNMGYVYAVLPISGVITLYYGCSNIIHNLKR